MVGTRDPEILNTLETPKKEAKGHFFVVSLNAICEMVKKGGLADDVMSYLVLARHTQGRGEWQGLLSTAGAKAIATKTGIPYRKAVKSLKWLEHVGLILPIDKAVSQPTFRALPEHFGKLKTRATTLRWVLRDGSEPLIILANTLIDGTQGAGEKTPPLMRMIDHMPISMFKKAEARLDALLLLLHLYWHHELDEYGGVNPLTALYGEWEHTLDSLDAQPHPPLKKYAISRKNTFAMTPFMEAALFYISEKEIRDQRFWNAFHNLERLGFIYEVIQIWDSDPSKAHDAEILYPLYILDRHARQSEPYLAKSIHETLIRHEAMTFDIPPFFEEIHTGIFRYLAYAQHYPLGVFRLRFRPKVTATGRWLKAEINKVSAWQTLFNKS